MRRFGPEIDPARIGYPVLAFVFLQITQGRLKEAIAELEAAPEVLEAHATSGPSDLLCRVAAQDTEQLQEIVNRLLTTRRCAARRATSCSRRRSSSAPARSCGRRRGARERIRCAMPRSTLTDPVRAVIQGRNFCHVSTLNENGSIHATLVWSDADGDHVVLNSAQGRRWPGTSSAPAARRCSSPTPRTSTSTSSSRRSSSRPARTMAKPSSTPSARSTRAVPTRR